MRVLVLALMVLLCVPSVFAYEYLVHETSTLNEYGKYDSYNVTLYLSNVYEYVHPTCFFIGMSIPSQDYFFYQKEQCFDPGLIPAGIPLSLPSTLFQVFPGQGRHVYVGAADEFEGELFSSELYPVVVLYDACFRPVGGKRFPLGMYSISSAEYETDPLVYSTLSGMNLNTILGQETFGYLNQEVGNVIVPAFDAGLDVILWLRGVFWWVGLSNHFEEGGYDVFGPMTPENFGMYSDYFLRTDGWYQESLFENINEYCRHDNLKGYILADEPVLGDLNLLNLRMVSDHVSLFDQQRSVQSVLAAGSVAFTSVDEFTEFIQATNAAVLNADIYPWNRWRSTSDSTEWFVRKMDVVRLAANQEDVELYLTAQAFQNCCDWSDVPGSCSWVYPSPNELRASVNLALLAGAKGILYWKWGDSQNDAPSCADGTVEYKSFKHVPELVNEVTELNDRISSVAPLLLGLSNTQYYNSTDTSHMVRVAGGFFQVGEFVDEVGTPYFGLVDRNFDKESSGQVQSQVAVAVQGGDRVMVTESFSGQVFSGGVVNGRFYFMDSFGPAQIKLYSVVASDNIFDVDDDGRVNLEDLLLVAADLHKPAGSSGFATDISGDGVVSMVDVVLLGRVLV